ncbi:efflux RND transporter periplasmic adaptor subunit [Limimaricola cinnabarinus]|uniref:Probable RND efflux membrane fusion protein n=1 Tax=Limimaricola cinnabarinus LL-001 TaxID=1337093 RepID=U3AAU8_9RHOB|nr:efflux RND transporter periplasmic adaptor subunit [Limimaricola cinnabarinus]GAD54804.1 probable RND efflux membrane fusion protein [Limimaricola cinnabarinus LL-001]
MLETVEVTPYSQRITALGTAQSRASVALVAEVSGRITALSLPADRQVAEGAALVTLDSEREAAELRIAEAELARTTDALDRYETLAASNSGAVQASALSEARAAQQTAQARLELARIALDERVIRAPISGRASLSDLSVGQSLSSGDAVTTIDDTARLVVSFELPEKALDLLDIGTTIEARAPAGRAKSMWRASAPSTAGRPGDARCRAAGRDRQRARQSQTGHGAAPVGGGRGRGAAGRAGNGARIHGAGHPGLGGRGRVGARAVRADPRAAG